MPELPKNFFSDYEKLLLNSITAFSKEVQDLYSKAVAEVSLEITGIKITDKTKSLADFPDIQKKIQQVLERMRTEMTATINKATKKAWDLSGTKNNKMLSSLLGGQDKIPAKLRDIYGKINDSAYQAFSRRREKGLNLSSRVWNLVQPFKNELEAMLADGINKGQDARKTAREGKKYLNEPDRLFRRVRDANGKLQLSKAAKNYKPGQGVYRSSFKNALRLTRTETNMGYREADQLRWRTTPFIIGVEIKLSLSHPIYDICDPCAGIYPKTFIWSGWHPQCLCFRVPVLASKKIRDGLVDEALGLIPEGTTKIDYVTDLPAGFKDFLNANIDRISGWKNEPYWLRDNKELLQPDSLDKLLRNARKAGPEVTATGKSFADKYGGTVTDINYKGYASARRKIDKEYGGNIDLLKDAVRNTVIVPMDQLQKIIAELKADPRFEKVKVQEGSAYFGYRGVLTNLKTKAGIMAEMQVNTPGMIYAKESRAIAEKLIGKTKWEEINKKTGLPGGLGHDYYEQIRVINPQTATDAQLEKLEELIKASIKYYSNFYGF